MKKIISFLLVVTMLFSQGSTMLLAYAAEPDSAQQVIEQTELPDSQLQAASGEQGEQSISLNQSIDYTVYWNNYTNIRVSFQAPETAPETGYYVFCLKKTCDIGIRNAECFQDVSQPGGTTPNCDITHNEDAEYIYFSIKLNRNKTAHLEISCMLNSKLEGEVTSANTSLTVRECGVATDVKACTKECYVSQLNGGDLKYIYSPADSYCDLTLKVADEKIATCSKNWDLISFWPKNSGDTTMDLCIGDQVFDTVNVHVRNFYFLSAKFPVNAKFIDTEDWNALIVPEEQGTYGVKVCQYPNTKDFPDVQILEGTTEVPAKRIICKNVAIYFVELEPYHEYVMKMHHAKAPAETAQWDTYLEKAVQPENLYFQLANYGQMEQYIIDGKPFSGSIRYIVTPEVGLRNYEITSSDPTVVSINDQQDHIDFQALKEGQAIISAHLGDRILGQMKMVVHDCQTITQGQPEQFNIPYYEAEQYVFTPQENGYYKIECTAAENQEWPQLSAYVLDTSQSQIVPVDCRDTNNSISGQSWIFTLEKGKNYIFEVLNGCNFDDLNGQLSITKMQNAESAVFAKNEVILYLDKSQFDSLSIETPNLIFSPDNSVADVKWSVDRQDILTLDPDNDALYRGRFTPKNWGDAIITATLPNGKTASCTIHIKNVPVYTLGEKVKVSVDAGDIVSYRVTVPETGAYTFYSQENVISESNSNNLRLLLREESNPEYKDWFAQGSLENEGLNYKSYQLKAGTEYILTARTNSNFHYDGLFFGKKTPNPSIIELQQEESVVYWEGETPATYGFYYNTLPVDSYAELIWTCEPAGILQLSEEQYVRNYRNNDRNYINFEILDFGTVTITATDPQGVSASKTVEIKAPSQLEQGVKSSALLEKNKEQILKFTPDKSGYYTFNTAIRSDSFSAVGFNIRIAQDIGFNRIVDFDTISKQEIGIINCGTICYMEAGQAYYIAAKQSGLETAEAEYIIQPSPAVEEIRCYTDEVYWILSEAPMNKSFLYQFEPYGSYAECICTSSNPEIFDVDDNTNEQCWLNIYKEGDATLTIQAGNVKKEIAVHIVNRQTLEESQPAPLIIPAKMEYMEFDFVPSVTGNYNIRCSGPDCSSIHMAIQNQSGRIESSVCDWHVEPDSSISCYHLEAGVHYSLFFNSVKFEGASGTVCVYQTPAVESMTFNVGNDFTMHYNPYEESRGQWICALTKPADAYDMITYEVTEGTAVKIENIREQGCVLVPTGEGTAVVTAKTDSGVTASCTVHVKMIVAEELNIDFGKNIYVGDTSTITVLPSPRDAAVKYTCTPAHDDVFRVDSINGRMIQITALKAGTDTLTITDEVSKIEKTITLTAKTISNLPLNQKTPFQAVSDETVCFLIRPAETGKYYIRTGAEDQRNVWTELKNEETKQSLDAFGENGEKVSFYELEKDVTYRICIHGMDDTAGELDWGKHTAVKKIVLQSDTSACYYIDREGVIGCMIDARFEPFSSYEKIVSWESQNEDIVTVENYIQNRCKVCPVKCGDATIIGKTESGKTAAFLVHVKEPATIRLNQTVQIPALAADDNWLRFVAPETGEYICSMQNESSQQKQLSCRSYDRVQIIGNTVSPNHTDNAVFHMEKGSVIWVTSYVAQEADNAPISIAIRKAVHDAEKINLRVNQKKVPGGYNCEIDVEYEPCNAYDPVKKWEISNQDQFEMYEKTKTIVTGKVVGEKTTLVVTATTEGGRTLSCTIGNLEAVSAPKLTISAEKESISVGESVTLTAAVSPEKDTVKWSCDNSQAVSLKQDGKTCSITGLSAGTAVILAQSSSGMKKTCIITVTDAVLQNIQAYELDPHGEKVFQFTPDKSGEYVFYTEKSGQPLEMGIFEGKNAVDVGSHRIGNDTAVFAPLYRNKSYCLIIRNPTQKIAAGKLIAEIAQEPIKTIALKPAVLEGCPNQLISLPEIEYTPLQAAPDFESFKIVPADGKDVAEIQGNKLFFRNLGTAELVISSGNVTASAKIVTKLVKTSGTCGENLNWSLEAGKLTISGTGEMSHYVEAPWHHYGASIETVVIEEGVTSIDHGAFDLPENHIAEITLPDSLVKIGTRAFAGASAVKQISVGSNVTEIGADAFPSGCVIKCPAGSVAEAYAHASNIACDPAVIYLAQGKIGNITWVLTTDGTLNIEGQGEIIIPNPVTAFFARIIPFANSDRGWQDYAAQIRHVEIGEGITSIGANAFAGLNKIESVTIPEGVTAIQKKAFYGCTSLQSVDIPSTMKEIQPTAFESCSANLEMKVEKTAKAADAKAAVARYIEKADPKNAPKLVEVNNQGTDGDLQWKFADGILTVSSEKSECAMNCYSADSAPWAELSGRITGLVIGKNISSLCNQAFANCSKLTSITVETGSTHYQLSGGLLLSAQKELVLCPADTESVTLDSSISKVLSHALTGKNLRTVVVDASFAGTLEASAVSGGVSVSGPCQKLKTVMENQTGIRLVPVHGEIELLPWGNDLPTCTHTEHCKEVCKVCGEILAEDVELKGTHKLIKYEAVAASCIENGNIAYWTCEHCKKIFADPSCNQEITLQDTVIPATGHKEILVPGKEPTCTEDGLTDGAKCAVCGEILVEQKIIPAVGHDWDEPVIVFAEDGKTATATVTCKNDSAHIQNLKVAITSAEKIPAGCETMGTTTYTASVKFEGKTYTAAKDVQDIAELGHDWGQWEVVKEPTLEEEGLKQRTCSRCKKTEQKSVLKLFDDVDPEAYFAEAVQWAAVNEITRGHAEGRFGPEEECARKQVVTFLWRAAGCPEPKSTTSGFADVPEDYYYNSAVCWAVENGITSGIDKTHFGPDKACARKQVVTFLWRAAGCPEPKSTTSGFADVPEDYYYNSAVCWAVENKITTGAEKDRFAPDDDCVRGQVVTFLYRDYLKENKN